MINDRGQDAVVALGIFFLESKLQVTISYNTTDFGFNSMVETNGYTKHFKKILGGVIYTTHTCMPLL